MAPVFLLCFTDSVHGSTEQQVLLLESFKAQPWTAVLSPAALSPVLRCNTLSGQGKTFVAEHKSFCWVNSTAGFESSPRQRNYTIKSSELQQRCSQTKLLLDLLQQINNNSQLSEVNHISTLDLTWFQDGFYNNLACINFLIQDLSRVEAPVWSCGASGAWACHAIIGRQATAESPSLPSTWNDLGEVNFLNLNVYSTF